MKKLIKYTKGSACARNLLFDNGFDDLNDFPLNLFVSGLGATILYKPMINSDGRIIFGKKIHLLRLMKVFCLKQKNGLQLHMRSVI